jgi:hypothetical protein
VSARGLIVGLSLAASALAMAGVGLPAAEAQEWKIYLRGKPEPITASAYAEETPWIFYRDDDSQYVFAVGCTRVERVERAGTPLPAPACPVERLPTTMPAVLIRVMDLEAKRLDDSISKLREQTRAYAQAVVGTFAVTGELFGLRGELQADLTRQRALDAVAFLQSQINDTLFDIRLTEQRVGALLDQSKSYPVRNPSRYFFFAR